MEMVRNETWSDKQEVWELTDGGREFLASRKHTCGDGALCSSEYTLKHIEQFLSMIFDTRSAVRPPRSVSHAVAIQMCLHSYDSWDPWKRPYYIDAIFGHMTIAIRYDRYAALAEKHGYVRAATDDSVVVIPSPHVDCKSAVANNSGSGGSMCILCEERPANALVSECRHLYMCMTCAEKPRHGCAICRGPAHNILQIYPT